MALKQITPTHWSDCWYCGKPVGLVGRVLAWLFGTRTHRCDFGNIAPPTSTATPELRAAYEKYLAKQTEQ
jgi:hypothetical protein